MTTGLHQVAETATLQKCTGCKGWTVRLRAGRCLICHRDHLGHTIDRDARDEADGLTGDGPVS